MLKREVMNGDFLKWNSYVVWHLIAVKLEMKMSMAASQLVASSGFKLALGPTFFFSDLISFQSHLLFLKIFINWSPTQ